VVNPTSGSTASATPAPPNARTLNAWRRWGYRLLPGDLFSYILHLRPAEWPIMAGHTLLGYVLAVGVSGALQGAHLAEALRALVIWVVFLNGGTLAINSVFDRDTGDIGYLNSPPQLPRYLLQFSLALLIGGQLLALTLPAGFQIAYAICFVLSILYSVPPFRFKAVAGVDWMINMWGFGTLTPYAAWAATGRPLDLGHGLVLLAFCPLFAGLYPLTQLYQFDEDRRRGDRTLALILGMRASLIVALVCTLLAFGTLAMATIVLTADGRWLIAPLVLWLAVLLPWLSRHDRWSASQHQSGMYRALAAWAVTDLTVLFVFAT
jgi:4-hydroxybenzoate polyprenyltransferase